jgi:hypothetical protein
VKKSGLRPWPDELQLTDDMKAFAYIQGIEPVAEFEAWHDSCLANGYQYKDWSAAWRTRVRNAVKFAPVHRAVNDPRPIDGGLARGSGALKQIKQWEKEARGAVNGPVNGNIGGVGRVSNRNDHRGIDSNPASLTPEQLTANKALLRGMASGIGRAIK